MKINIIGTGSTGNSILLCDSVLIDIGLTFNAISDHAQQIKAVLLTHRHGDHLNKSTIRRLYAQNEKVKFCCGEFIFGDLLMMGVDRKRIVVIDAGGKYKIDDVTFSPFDLHHDVPNFGYRVMQGGKKLIYATDTFSLDGITAKNYDYGLIEANHDLDTALEIIRTKMLDGEFCHLNRAIKTHLSVDKAIKFINENQIKKWYPVHIGASTAKKVNEKIGEFQGQ